MNVSRCMMVHTTLRTLWIEQAVAREIAFLERKLEYTDDVHLIQQLEKLYEAL